MRESGLAPAGHKGMPPRMIVIAALTIGALVGWRRAKSLGGNARDGAQYAAAFGMIFLLVGLFVTILIDRLA